MTEPLMRIAAKDGHALDAYLKEVAHAKGAVVIVQEIFGLTHHIRTMVDRYAAYGYTTLAPALFDRVERNLVLSYDEGGLKQGKEIANGLKAENILADIEAAITYLDDLVPRARIGVIGYCFGGSYAWLSATRLRPDAVVCFYGSLIAKFAAETPRCPVQMHFGKQDHSISPEDIEKIRSAHPEIALHLYDAGHGFCCDERESFSPECAHLAFKRSVEFLDEKVGIERKPITADDPTTLL